MLVSIKIVIGSQGALVHVCVTLWGLIFDLKPKSRVWGNANSGFLSAGCSSMVLNRTKRKNTPHLMAKKLFRPHKQSSGTWGNHSVLLSISKVVEKTVCASDVYCQDFAWSKASRWRWKRCEGDDEKVGHASKLSSRCFFFPHFIYLKPFLMRMLQKWGTYKLLHLPVVLLLLPLTRQTALNTVWERHGWWRWANVWPQKSGAVAVADGFVLTKHC